MDVGARPAVADRMLERERRGVAGQRMRGQAALDPGVRSALPSLKPQAAESDPGSAPPARRWSGGRRDARVGVGLRIDRERVLAALQHDRVEVHQVRQPFRDPIGHARDRDAAEAVAHQDHVVQLLGLDDLHQVLDEGIDGDAAGQQVGAVAHAGIAGRVHPVACRRQALGHRPPAPAAMPGAMRQHIGLAAGVLPAALCACRPPARAATAGRPATSFSRVLRCIIAIVTPAPGPGPDRRSGRRCVRCRSTGARFLAHAGLLQLFGIELAVRGGRRVRGQRLGVADVDQAGEQLQRVLKRAPVSRPPFTPKVNRPAPCRPGTSAPTHGRGDPAGRRS